MQLPNRTWPLLDGKGNIFALDVFHQLHCLVCLSFAECLHKTHLRTQDTLRKELSPVHYSGREPVPVSHIRHCIGAIRQALMCSADISTIVWQWSDEFQMVEQRDDIPHVCRDFNLIRDWASEQTFENEEVDFSVYMDDGLSMHAN
jgi:hypothetical protein